MKFIDDGCETKCDTVLLTNNQRSSRYDVSAHYHMQTMHHVPPHVMFLTISCFPLWPWKKEYPHNNPLRQKITPGLRLWTLKQTSPVKKIIILEKIKSFDGGLGFFEVSLSLSLF